MYSVTLTTTDLEAQGVPAVALPGGRRNGPRRSRPLGAVFHTPGVVFAEQVLAELRQSLGREPTDEEYEVAAAAAFDPRTYQPGYLVGVTGRIFQLEGDTRVTWHAGTLARDCPAGDVYGDGRWWHWAKPLHGHGWALHGRQPTRVYDYWVQTFPGAGGPLDVFPWGRHPNLAIGIDLLPDVRRGGTFSAAQRASAAILVRLLAATHDFAVGLRTVSTHSLTSPCERGTVLRTRVVNGTDVPQVLGIHWDPPRARWDHIAFVEEVAG